MSSDPTAAPVATPVQTRAMRQAVWVQCLGTLTFQALQGGVVLLYLKAMEVSNIRIMLYLSIPSVLHTLVLLPSAYLGDRHGKRKLGFVGMLLALVGFLLLAGAGLAASVWSEALAVVGLAVYSAGYATFVAQWFALLSPIVPVAMRGRFFGRLRFSWQLVGIVFMAVCGLVLSKDSPVRDFQAVLAVAAIAHAFRAMLFRQIPELEQPVANSTGFMPALWNCLAAAGYMPFCAYVFLLTLFTAGCPMIFGLVEKTVLRFGDNLVVWLGGLGMVGAVFGYALVGGVVDRLGTRSVFLVCHFGFGAALLLFLARSLATTWSFQFLGGVHFAFGFLTAASSVAISTEMLALIPGENKSLATSICLTLLYAGGSLSGLIAAWALKIGFLRETWTLGKAAMTQYDAVLLAYSGMIVLLVVTLGLVPSVLRRPDVSRDSLLGS